jgi:hypothetical protein
LSALWQCTHSILLSSRVVDIQPQSPTLPPSPVSPSAKKLVNLSQSSSSSNSQSFSPNLRDNSKSSFRKAPSRFESTGSTASERVVLMTGAEQSSVVQPLLTDLYQISMAYAYWKSRKHEELSTFDLYFRKNRKSTQDF